MCVLMHCPQKWENECANHITDYHTINVIACVGEKDNKRFAFSSAVWYNKVVYHFLLETEVGSWVDCSTLKTHFGRL